MPVASNIIGDFENKNGNFFLCQGSEDSLVLVLLKFLETDLQNALQFLGISIFES